ncbi:unnamed protein product [Zymoseptoria tritici ST99CH_1A5]|uniref:Cullin family profile domain-containing protein n=1 Tax=Zymoseptoria tritici ST99CH_1A5 TaxID=1276529 RepID=A0A1Y6LWX6_ZYMTR|nr:unnamed protein product [Zymoseptoria tritici ST99CH_1A5]
MAVAVGRARQGSFPDSVFASVFPRQQHTTSSRRPKDHGGSLHQSGSMRLPIPQLRSKDAGDSVTKASFQSQKQAIKTTLKCLHEEHCHCDIDLESDLLSRIGSTISSGSNKERAAALAVHRILRDAAVQRRCFQVDWSGRASVMPKLRGWIRDCFVPATEQAISTLTGEALLKLPAEQFVSAAENHLGRSRVSSLFDYVRSWPSSQGAILDIREYLSTNGPNEKAHLCASFLDQFQRRLLHAGASTTEILGIYISVIHVFQALDSRGVLLEKVASRIRNYLRGRDDTATIIADSLLADIDEVNGTVTGHDPDKVCPDIAHEVITSAVDAKNDKMIDWSDMTWMPDPIDAGPNYKSSKSDDVVAHILALFEKEDFAKAFTAAIGDNFLHKTGADFSKEIKIIELLKARLDAGQMHNAEVMLKDMQDSVALHTHFNPRTTNIGTVTPKEIQRALPAEGIHGDVLYDMFKTRIDRKMFGGALSLVATRRGNIYYPKRARLPLEPIQPTTTHPELDVKVMSSHFWPEYPSEEFKIPHQIQQKLDAYEQQYKNFNGTRVVRWKHVQSRADVVLELEDRTVEDVVDAFKASVIDVFCNDPQGDLNTPLIQYDPATGLSSDEIAEALEMPHELVLLAIHHWTSSKVLYELTPGKYAVLERLDMEPGIAADSSTEDVDMDEGMLAALADERKLKEQAPMFSMFISTLLTNNGPRPVEGPMGITNMVKMVIPTFTWGDEHVLMLLRMMEGEGLVECNGDTWKKA